MDDALSPVLQEDLAALRAEVARQGEELSATRNALWELLDQMPSGTMGRNGAAELDRIASILDHDGALEDRAYAALDAPVPPADAPLPEAVMQRAEPLSPLSPEVEAALAVIRKASDAGLFDAKPETARALAAWARAQQQPAPNASGYSPVVAAALGALETAGWSYRVAAPGEALDDGGDPAPALPADVREAMREAADRLGTWQRYRGRIEAARASDLALAARLRELAGERGRGFATIPGWRADEP